MEENFFHDGSSWPLKIRESFYNGKKVRNSILPCFSMPITQAIAPCLATSKQSNDLYKFRDIITSIIFSFDIMCNVQVNEFVKKIRFHNALVIDQMSRAPFISVSLRQSVLQTKVARSRV